MVLQVGQSGCGKHVMVESLARLVGRELRVMQLTADTDALELLGSFEQVGLVLLLL